MSDVASDLRADAPLPDVPKDVGKDVGQDTAGPDDVGSDSSEPLEPYHLESAPVPKDHEAYYPHKGFFGADALENHPDQSRLNALPFSMSLRADGKTLRVGVAWLNGYGAVVSMSMPNTFGQDPLRCLDVTDGLLPSGLLYYDIDTVTDEPRFVGEVVLTPSSAELMRWHWPLALEVFGDLSEVGGVSSCTTTIPGFGMCLAVNGKEYLFPMCRHTSEMDAGQWYPPGCVEYPLLCGRGCIERQDGEPRFDLLEMGFVDTVGQRLHSMVVRDLVLQTEKPIPLPIAGEQISRSQALRSECVQGGNSEGQQPYACGAGTPYYVLERARSEDPLIGFCCGNGIEFGYESTEEYLAKAPQCAGPNDIKIHYLDNAYYDRFEGRNGAFIQLFVSHMAVWDGASEGTELERTPPFSAEGVVRGWLPSGNWYFSTGNGTPFLPIGLSNRYVESDSGSGELGPPCYFWTTSLLEGSLSRGSFRVESSGAEMVFRSSTTRESTWSLNDIKSQYESVKQFADMPACSLTQYRSVPLYDYPYL